jgi:4-hydroxy-3-polyprenylbenzoate decarboxylase
MKRKIIVAITGASGSLYGVEFLKIMQSVDAELHGIISDAGEKVMQLEMGLARTDLDQYVQQWHDVKNIGAPMASGSSGFDAMVVLPCTMGTLASIANGISTNLIHRAADVILKEKRPLIMAIRETPFNRTHMQNMLNLHDSGATIYPAMPSFYSHPQTITAMARGFAGRIASMLGFDIPDLPKWQGG